MDSGQLQERLDGAVSDALHVEIEPGIFGSGAAAAGTSCGIANQSSQLKLEFPHVRWVEEEAVSVFNNDFGYAAETGRQNRQAAGHGVDQCAGHVKVI